LAISAGKEKLNLNVATKIRKKKPAVEHQRGFSFANDG
jgi:hypothetical protein